MQVHYNRVFPIPSTHLLYVIHFTVHNLQSPNTLVLLLFWANYYLLDQLKFLENLPIFFWYQCGYYVFILLLYFLTIYEPPKTGCFLWFLLNRFLWLLLKHYWSHWLTAIQYLPISRETWKARFVPVTEMLAVINICSTLFFQVEGYFNSTRRNSWVSEISVNLSVAFPLYP